MQCRNNSTATRVGVKKRFALKAIFEQLESILRRRTGVRRQPGLSGVLQAVPSSNATRMAARPLTRLSYFERLSDELNSFRQFSSQLLLELRVHLSILCKREL